MQRYTIFFIIVNALHVSGAFSAHQREFKNCTHRIWYTASGSSKQAWHIPDAVCRVFELLMMGFSAHHQELKISTHSNWYMPSLLASVFITFFYVRYGFKFGVLYNVGQE